jgi:hypothetical protein
MIAGWSIPWWIQRIQVMGLLLLPLLILRNAIKSKPGEFVNRYHRAIEICAAAFIFLFLAVGLIINLIKR